jgi:hypothetical protein
MCIDRKEDALITLDLIKTQLSAYGAEIRQAN